MALASGFFNSFGGDRVYDATDFSRYLEGIIVDGCLPNDTGFLITPNPEPIGGNPPSVIISPGKAYMKGMWANLDVALTYNMGVAQQVVPGKQHLLFLTFDTNDNVRNVSVDCITAINPTLPVNGNGIYHLPLGIVADQMNSQPLAGHITDQRLYAGVSAIGATITALAPALAAFLVPVGSGQIWFADSAPTGYLLCQGQSLLIATYPELSALLRPVWGGADGTHFYLPDMRSRVPVGYKSSDTNFDALSKVGGRKDAVLPSHSHRMSNLTNTIILPRTSGGNTSGAGNLATGGNWSYGNLLDTTTVGTVLTGNENLPPYMTVNYIVKY